MKYSKDLLGTRMKGYENIPRIHLTPRMPIVIRVDGKAFHTFTRGFVKPWDDKLQKAMTAAATTLVDEIQGAELAYIQSDEISVVLNTYKYFETQQYFDGNVQKIASVAASLATAGFNLSMWSDGVNKTAYFDARCFVIPREEAVNYFLWRYQDCVRNSVSSIAQSKFSHTKLHGVNQKGMKDMLKSINCDWDNCRPIDKWGTFMFKNGETENTEFMNIKQKIENCLVQIES